MAKKNRMKRHRSERTAKWWQLERPPRNPNVKWWQPEIRPPGVRAQRLIEKLFGPVPKKGASEAEQLRFVRRISARSMLVYGPVMLVILILGTPTWMTFAICTLILVNIANIFGMTRKIRQKERSKPEGR